MKRELNVHSKYRNLFIILLLIANTVAAQDVTPDSKESKMFNNAIYGNVGVGGLFVTATACYERMFARNGQKSIVATFVKAGYGGAAYWGHSTPYILGNFGFLTGVTKHHLEVSGGFVKSLDEYYDLFPLSVSIGYRIQKPNGHFILRTGAGWPEGFYFGLGVSF
ncbi:MAG: hypothetical protein JNL53_01755 [Cyclobacteriaceae bacterium]|nr:hypothetical protein [Cyclobacteriaceae bacterium]